MVRPKRNERRVEKNALYRCLDKILPHGEAFVRRVRTRYEDIFAARIEILFYDLAATCFEINPPLDENDKRRCGCSRDKRFEGVPMVIALIVTREGVRVKYIAPDNECDVFTESADRLRQERAMRRRPRSGWRSSGERSRQ